MQQIPVLQNLEHSPEMVVKMFYLVCIVQHIGTHGIIVRPEIRNLVNHQRRLAALADSAPIFVFAMRLSGAIPEEPRPIAGVIEEIFEIGRIVTRIDLRSRLLGLPLVVGLASEKPFNTILHSRISGTPTLGGVSYIIAILSQDFSENLMFLREIANMIASLPELPGVLSGQKTGSGRS